MKDLEKYFDKAAKQKEIVSLSEIDEMLSLKGKPARSRRYHLFSDLLQRKELRFASLGIAAILFGAIVFFAVKVRVRPEQEVFIPKTQRRIMHLVKNISDHPENSEIKLSQFGQDTNAQVTGIPIHLRSKFELSEDQLELLGISFFDEYIQYEGNVKGRGYVAFRILRTGSKPPPKFYPLEVSGIQRPGIEEYEFYPWFMTDEAGYQGFRYRFRDEPPLKTTSSFFLNAIDELIPIQINRPGFEKVIFWFSQTPDLMNILESAARVSKKAEIPDYQDAGRRKSTIEIEIFPTITKGDVTVRVNVLKRQKLEVTLLNSSGEVLQAPVTDRILDQGNHNFSMDLSALRKGLYFVRIKSDPGLTTIHRLFKE